VKKFLLTEKLPMETIDESMISGEPIPLDKKADDTVIAGTINGNKSFVMIAEKIETLFANCANG
jgi:cation transport ATPase